MGHVYKIINMAILQRGVVKIGFTYSSFSGRGHLIITVCDVSVKQPMC